MSAFHDIKLKALGGQELPLANFRNKVVLVVNVASKCGLTPQYAALENLYQQYKDKGLEILGLPCNQFAGQEPGTEQEIAEFCQLNYGVTFTLGENSTSTALTVTRFTVCSRARVPSFPGISPNFEKFLVGKNGGVSARFLRVPLRMILP